jgi:mRNA interferase YafQ
MRTIERSSVFKRDYKREMKARHPEKLVNLLNQVIGALAADLPLPAANRDHALSGPWPWKDYRDCHIRPDLVLIYRKPDLSTLQLIRLGSHTELFE